MKNQTKSKRGGARPGTGPKLKYGEPLKMVSVKVPESKLWDFKKKARDIVDGYLLYIENNQKL